RLHSLIHCHSLTAAAPHAIYTLSLHDALPIFISSGFIIIFIIHSGALRVVTPSSLGPINFLSILWQAVHILPKTSSPCAAIASSISAGTVTDLIGPIPLLERSTRGSCLSVFVSVFVDLL